jgi:hypothetical protein
MWANITCNSLSSNVESEKLKVLIGAIAKSLRKNDQASPEWASYGEGGFLLNTGATIDDCPYWPTEEQDYEGFASDEIQNILKIVEEKNLYGEYFFLTLSVILQELGWLPDELPCGTVQWGYEDGPGGDPDPFPYFGRGS